jgi:nucleoside-diphosphate-sugar epimerase
MSTVRYLVTGGFGYIGRHVVKHLQALGNEVVPLGRPQAGTGAVDFLKSDASIYRRLGSPDVCIHMAWHDNFAHSSASHLERLAAHQSFVTNMLRGGCRHFVGIGSMHEVGNFVGPIKEDTPTNPTTAYGIAKDHLRRVQALVAREEGATSQWLRCFYIMGDDARNNSLFTKLLAAEEAKAETFPMNSGEHLFDFVRVEELGRQIAEVCSQTAVSGVINCCSGEPVSLKTKVLEFIAEHQLRIRPVWGEYPERPYDSKAIWGDVTKLNAARAAAAGRLQ